MKREPESVEGPEAWKRFEGLMKKEKRGLVIFPASPNSSQSLSIEGPGQLSKPGWPLDYKEEPCYRSFACTTFRSLAKQKYY